MIILTASSAIRFAEREIGPLWFLFVTLFGLSFKYIRWSYVGFGVTITALGVYAPRYFWDDNAAKEGSGSLTLPGVGSISFGGGLRAALVLCGIIIVLAGIYKDEFLDYRRCKDDEREIYERKISLEDKYAVSKSEELFAEIEDLGDTLRAMRRECMRK